MSEKRSFVPYQGREETISTHPFKEGSIYFATDTGRMYLDTVSNGRIPVGGGASGISFYYSLDNGIEIKTDEDEDEEKKEVLYTLTIAGLEDDSSSPKVGDILLGADKVFYKIKDITETDFICERLAIAGGGDFETSIRPKLVV